MTVYPDVDGYIKTRPVTKGWKNHP